MERLMDDTDQQLAALLTPPTVASLDEVVARIALIEQTLPLRDGLGWFNKLYKRVTDGIVGGIEDGTFARPDFMRTLDIALANIYFEAVLRDVRNLPGVPRAWRPLFEVRGERRIAPIQFALAGMNAHINRDIPIAVCGVLEGSGRGPDARLRSDFMRINSILQRVESDVKDWFAVGFLDEIDETFPGLEDVVAMWSLTHAREVAWVNAETLWHIRNMPPLEATFRMSLDRTVGFASRGLLVKTGL